MSNLKTTLNTQGTTASCPQSFRCCRDKKDHLSTWNTSSPEHTQGTSSLDASECHRYPKRGKMEDKEEEKRKGDERQLQKKGKEQERKLEKEMATHSSILAWTEEPGRLQPMGSRDLDMTQRLNHQERKQVKQEMHLISCSCSRAPPPQAECVPM